MIRERPLLVHHPYESFASSVESFIAQAADDPRVQSIKMTMYRAGGDSPIARSLMRAAERGVQVAVLVELKARFDEATNVSWAKALERSGVHVVYGLVGLKTHAKTVLVVRNDDDGLRRYCHIGTGNYNSRTARIYEDMGFITSDPQVGSDVATVQPPHGLQPHPPVQNLLIAPQMPQPATRPDRTLQSTYGPEDTSRRSSTRSPTQASSARSTAPRRQAPHPDLLVRHLLPLVPGVPA
ncbi:MAG: hypothetical protein H6514_20720 [Acidimicrobiaceae bacterium]|nr:hypothetical protein [Acidimicrobiaceae bacterium]